MTTPSAPPPSALSRLRHALASLLGATEFAGEHVHPHLTEARRRAREVLAETGGDEEPLATTAPEETPSLPLDHAGIVAAVQTWLGPDGIEFFRRLKREHDTLNAVWKEWGKIPHIVHFREGMQVRNYLRKLTNGAWTAHEYDDQWIGIVEEAIAETL